MFVVLLPPLQTSHHCIWTPCETRHSKSACHLENRTILERGQGLGSNRLGSVYRACKTL